MTDPDPTTSWPWTRAIHAGEIVGGPLVGVAW